MNVGITIGKENFDAEVLQSPIPVLIEFWAPWCGSCKMQMAVLAELAEQFAGQIKIAALNVEDEAQVAETHQVIAVPSLALYKQGNLVRKQTGAIPRSQLEALIRDSIAVKV